MIYIMESGIKRKAEQVNCKQCGKKFIKRLNKTRKYCSRICASSSKNKNVELQCKSCGKTFLRTKSALKKSKHKIYFCTKQCKDYSQTFQGNCKEIWPNRYGTGKYSYRWIITKSKNPLCIGCKESKSYLLSVHHIDGNRNNNPIDGSNWEIVCGNCHIKRHLKLKNGKWQYDSNHLTPKKYLKKL